MGVPFSKKNNGVEDWIGKGGKDAGTGDRSGTEGGGVAGAWLGLRGAGGFPPVDSPIAGKGRGGAFSSSSEGLTLGLEITAGETWLEFSPGKGLPNTRIPGIAGIASLIGLVWEPLTEGEPIGVEIMAGGDTGGDTDGKAPWGDRLS